MAIEELSNKVSAILQTQRLLPNGTRYWVSDIETPTVEAWQDRPEFKGGYYSVCSINNPVRFHLLSKPASEEPRKYLGLEIGKKLFPQTNYVWVEASPRSSLGQTTWNYRLILPEGRHPLFTVYEESFLFDHYKKEYFVFKGLQRTTLANRRIVSQFDTFLNAAVGRVNSRRGEGSKGPEGLK